MAGVGWAKVVSIKHRLCCLGVRLYPSLRFNNSETSPFVLMVV